MIPHTLQFAKKCNSLQILFEKTFAISFYLYYVVCLRHLINVSYVKKVMQIYHDVSFGVLDIESS